jgi:hypothetical protein
MSLVHRNRVGFTGLSSDMGSSSKPGLGLSMAESLMCDDDDLCRRNSVMSILISPGEIQLDSDVRVTLTASHQ